MTFETEVYESRTSARHDAIERALRSFIVGVAATLLALHASPFVMVGVGFAYIQWVHTREV